MLQTRPNADSKATSGFQAPQDPEQSRGKEDQKAREQRGKEARDVLLLKNERAFSLTLLVR